MSDELDRRAALAMGWTWIQHTSETFDESDGHWTAQNGHMERYFFSPSTDRNDLAELLREVERRGEFERFVWMLKLELFRKEQREDLAQCKIEKWLLTADPAIVCRAAVETLEGK